MGEGLAAGGGARGVGDGPLCPKFGGGPGRTARGGWPLGAGGGPPALKEDGGALGRGAGGVEALHA